MIKGNELRIGNVIQFTYKGGRNVEGKVLHVSEKVLICKLLTDYIGKNVEWFSGEEKQFNIKECRNLQIKHFTLTGDELIINTQGVG
jgi:hypothetical protein